MAVNAYRVRKANNDKYIVFANNEIQALSIAQTNPDDFVSVESASSYEGRKLSTGGTPTEGLLYREDNFE